MEGNTRAKVIISGRVQGVWFRDWTCKTAEPLGLTGYVKNLPDGSVEAVFEGPEENVNQMLTKVRTGPPLAKVTNVEVEHGECTGEYQEFRLEH